MSVGAGVRSSDAGTKKLKSHFYPNSASLAPVSQETKFKVDIYPSPKPRKVPKAVSDVL